MNCKRLLVNLGMIGVLASCTTNTGSGRDLSFETLNADFPAIFEAARYASSSHNVQPWRVTAEDHNSLLISVEKTRRLPEVDPENREILLSIGGFIESVVQAAAALGYDPRVELLIESHTDNDIARITLKKTNRPIEWRTLNLMRSVYTEKGSLSTNPIAQDDIQAVITAEGINSGGGLHYFPGSSNEAAWVLAEAPEAALLQSERDPVQRELVDLMHFSKKSAAEKPVGITPEMMGLGGFTRIIWYTFFSPETMMKDSNRKTIRKITKDQLENSGGILAVTSDSNSPKNLIETGRLYQRTKIAAFERGIIIHPISQLLEEENWKGLVSEKLGTKHPVQYITRIGYRLGKPIDFEADAVTSASIRMRPEQFVSVK